MPLVIIDGPTIENIDDKRVLVKDITDVLEKTYKLPREAYIVLIKENPPENVGSGGVLVLDKKK